MFCSALSFNKLQHIVRHSMILLLNDKSEHDALAEGPAMSPWGAMGTAHAADTLGAVERLPGVLILSL